MMQATRPELQGHVPVQRRQVALGALRVAGQHVGGSAEALDDGGHVGQPPRAGMGVAPPQRQPGHVDQNVPEGAEFPVQHRGYRAVGGHDAVVEAVVAVDDAHALLFGDRGFQPVVQLPHQGQVPVGPLVHLALPAAQLARAVALPSAQVAQPHLVGIQRVKVRHGVDDRAGHHRAHRLVDRHGVGPVEHHRALHIVHDIEVGAVHVGVGAQPQRDRHGHRCGGESRDDPVLAGHVVGAGQHMAGRGAPQHHPAAGTVGDDEGEVGSAARDRVEVERRDGPHLGGQPRRDRLGVDSLWCSGHGR